VRHRPAGFDVYELTEIRLDHHLLFKVTFALEEKRRREHLPTRTPERQPQCRPA
jgi:hypothetical protein